MRSFETVVWGEGADVGVQSQGIALRRVEDVPKVHRAASWA